MSAFALNTFIHQHHGREENKKIHTHTTHTHYTIIHYTHMIHINNGHNSTKRLNYKPHSNTSQTIAQNLQKREIF